MVGREDDIKEALNLGGEDAIKEPLTLEGKDVIKDVTPQISTLSSNATQTSNTSQRPGHTKRFQQSFLCL